MEIFQAIILGIIQGITEWLPISSSGHLVLAQQFFGLTVPLIFDILLHLGSLIVILIFFRKEIKELIIGLIKWQKKQVAITLYLLIGTIPIALVGYFLQDKIAIAFQSLTMVGVGLLFTSLLLFLSRFRINKKTEERKSPNKQKITWQKALVMGLFQSIALIPGVSRSGSTISSGLILGIKREEAARFSFLLFIPAIIGALILELPNFVLTESINIYIIGTVVSAIVGFFSLGLLMRIIKNNKFHWFSIYCFILGIIILIIA